MPVSTSEGEYFDSHEDMVHAQLFGSKDNNEETEKPKLYGVRHGCTDLNDEDLIHGWVNEPLNEEGIAQAHKAAESLKDKDITHIVSSDLPRARQTANIIASKLKVPVTFDSNLRTWDSGDFDYTNKHKELEKYTRANG